MTLKIGITGPIGCGKSTVAHWLGERSGVIVIDADHEARRVSGARWKRGSAGRYLALFARNVRTGWRTATPTRQVQRTDSESGSVSASRPAPVRTPAGRRPGSVARNG